MNKKLLALAVAGAFVAPVAAMADTGNVTIYGVMSASVNSVNPGWSSSTINGNASSQSVNQINDDSSRIGFKGTEALGNGMSAVWQIESSIFPDAAAPAAGFQGQSNGALNARNTFVGLTGGFGTTVLGRHDTPYKLSTRGLDVFGDGIADNRSLMGGGLSTATILVNSAGVGTNAASGSTVATSGTTSALAAGAGTSFDGRQSNVIAYISPTVNGLTGAIGYVAGSENATTSGGIKGNAWSAMANYANGPLYASLAYEKHNIGTRNTGSTGSPDGTITLVTLANKEEKAWKLGLGYTMDALKLGFAYEKTSDNFGDVFNNATVGSYNSKNSSDLYGHNAYYLSAAYTMGSNVLKAAYTKVGNSGRADQSGAKQYAIGMDHNFSKRTKLYAVYTKLDNDTNAYYGLTGGSNGGAVTQSVTTTASAAAVATSAGFDSNPSAVSVGLRHEF